VAQVARRLLVLVFRQVRHKVRGQRDEDATAAVHGNIPRAAADLGAGATDVMMQRESRITGLSQ
jgi:hypothetical protein